MENRDASLLSALVPPRSPADYRAGAGLCKALGHPSRLLIIDALAAGPLCVADLTALIGCDMSTVSNHLTVLRHHGLLLDERRGTQIFYRLANTCILAVFECLKNFGVAPAQVAARSQPVSSGIPAQ